MPDIMTYEGSRIDEILSKIEFILDDSINHEAVRAVMQTIGIACCSDMISELRIYSEYLPMAEEIGFTEKERNLQFLWEAIDRYPISLAVNFAYLYRRLIAKRAFLSCGRNLICESDVRFNFGRKLSIDDDVFISRGAFLDTKGGIKIGSSVEIGEYVRILTHSHCESDQTERSYSPVTVEPYSKILAGALVLPGVTIGEGAIVREGSVVTEDVHAWSVVSGNPAKFIRERKHEGKLGAELNHTWFNRGAFQNEEKIPDKKSPFAGILPDLKSAVESEKGSE
jgi:acetyltransferase-like isoleucine patch superfamily enzyme